MPGPVGPLFGQRARRVRADLVASDRPGRRQCSGHSAEGVQPIWPAGVRAPDQCPASSVPVLDERLQRMAVPVLSDRPRVVRRRCGHPVQYVPAGRTTCVGTGHQLPADAIPMLDQRSYRTALRVGTDGPGVPPGRRGHCVENVLHVPAVRAGDDRPLDAGPGLDEGRSSAGTG